MLSSPFSLRLLIAFACAVGIPAVVVGMLESGRIREAAHRETEASLRAGAASLAEITRPGLRRRAVAPAVGENTPSLQRVVQRLLDSSTDRFVRFTVFDASGAPVADSRLRRDRLGNLKPLSRSLRDRLATASSSDSVESRSDPAVQEVDILECTRRVDEVAGSETGDDGSSSILGYVRMSRPDDRHLDGITALRRSLFAGVALGALVAAGAAYWIARYLADPVLEVRDALAAMIDGDFGRRVRIDREDLVGDLARTCNELGKQSGRTIENLANERRRVVAMLSSMVDGVVATDGNQSVLFINDAARRMLGVENPSEECIGEPLWELARVPSIGSFLEAALESRREVEEEIALTGLGGDRTLELRASPLRSENAALRGAVVVFHDVTELRRLEQVRRDFVANVSHELKTPITVIVGVVEMLLDDPDMEVGMREHFLRKLNDQSDRLTALIADQLTLARVEARGIPSERVCLDLRDVVGAGVSLIEALAERKQIAVSVDFPDVPALVVGDPETLRQVANNLLGNAVAYTPEGGAVGVAIWIDDTMVTFEVSDTGIGLSTEDQQRVFERFYRVDRSRGRELGGTGLGLSIVRNVVVAHGGQVAVKSELGRGSTFTVRLPRSFAELSGRDASAFG